MQTGQRIVCATDLCEDSEEAMAQAAEMARTMGQDLELLHVWEPSDERAQAKLEKIRDRLAEDGLRVSTKFIQSADPAAAIVDRVSDRSVSMLVLGTHGYSPRSPTSAVRSRISGAARWTVGSVADCVLRAAGVPVLTVRSRR
jgi:nucleotide-binding universal stress UspA family protein